MQGVAPLPQLEVLGPLVRDSVRENVHGDRDFTFMTLIKLGMNIVERFCDQNPQGAEFSKRDMCYGVLSAIIFECMRAGLITGHEGMQMQTRIDQGKELVDDAIETLISISKNPTFIQLAHHVEEATTACSKRCRKRSRAKGPKAPDDK